MFPQLVFALLFLAIIVPIGAFYLGERKPGRFKNMLAVNLVSFFAVLIFSAALMFSPAVFAAASEDVLAGANGMAFLAAALSTGLGALGSGIATGQAASAALGALSENESIMGKALIFVGLSEGISIFGLVISFMILNYVVV